VARVLQWAVVAAVLSGVTVNVLRLRGDVSLAGPSVPAQALAVVAGAALIIAGGAGGQGRVRWFLPAAGAAWLAAEWASPAAPGAVVFTVGLIVIMAPLPLVLAARRQHRSVAAGATALLALAVLCGLAGALLSGPLAATAASPRDVGCTDCPADLIAAVHDVPLNARLTQVGGLLAVAAALIAVAWLAASLAGMLRPPRSRALAPARLADVSAVAFAFAAAADEEVRLRGGPAGQSVYGWHAVAGVMVLVLSAAVAGPALRAARARRVVASAALTMADDTGQSAADALSAALNDAGLKVAYPMPDGTWRDRHGQMIILPRPGATLVTDSGENLAALVHGRPSRADLASVTGAVSAARILLDIERIEAGALARVSDLRSARRLAVEAADAARARLERDLHDGAQQRLVALRYALGLASARASRLPEPDHAARLLDADRAAEQALAHLRDLAHGISSATLAAEGLAGAVRSAVEQAPGSVTIVELPDGRLPEQVQRAVYRLIADALRETGRMPSQDLSLAVRHAGRDVFVEVEYDRATATQGDWPPRHLADRVAAAGGQIQLASRGGRQRLIAVLPCE
jgi:signal transduction histidine kinase